MDVFTHMVVAFVMYQLLGLALPIELVFFIFMFANWLPDIDHLIGSIYKALSARWTKSEKRLNQWQKVAYFPRTILHSFWGALFLGGVFWVIFGQFAAGLSMFLGVLLHLAIDSFDKAGVKWFYPWFHVTGKIPVTYLPDQKRIGMNNFLKYALRINAGIVVVIILFKFIL